MYIFETIVKDHSSLWNVRARDCWMHLFYRGKFWFFECIYRDFIWFQDLVDGSDVEICVPLAILGKWDGGKRLHANELTNALFGHQNVPAKEALENERHMQYEIHRNREHGDYFFITYSYQSATSPSRHTLETAFKLVNTFCNTIHCKLKPSYATAM